MKILVVSSNYPSLQNPSYGAFVYNLMQEIALEHEVTVISPLQFKESLKTKKLTYGKEICTVFRPRFLSLSNKKIGFIDTGKISSYFYKKSICKVLNNYIYTQDVIYCHFLINALPVIDYAIEHNIPVVVASGESTYSSFENYDLGVQQKLIQNITHIICVSNENKRQLIDLGFVEENISVIPNAVNYDLFKPISQERCREKLGFPKSKFIVGFIGHFIDRKGPNRIIEAIESLQDGDIHLVCVGSKGELKKTDFTTIILPVANVQLPEVYNSFNVFVLPTLYEGSCNVIEEAKACCLPIISSLGTSVEEQLINNKTGILIDPMDIESIANSIREVKTNSETVEVLKNNLKNIIGENSLANRATKISDLLKNIVNEF